jgi:hypothetical protein
MRCSFPHCVLILIPIEGTCAKTKVASHLISSEFVLQYYTICSGLECYRSTSFSYKQSHHIEFGQEITTAASLLDSTNHSIKKDMISHQNPQYPALQAPNVE